MIKVGVIGCGRIAERHLAAFNKLDNIAVMVFDEDPKLCAVAERYGVSWQDDLDGIYDLVDAIDICTPTPSHYLYLTQALAKHKHVFVEKPMTATLEQAYLVQESARAAGTVAMVGHPYRFHPAYQFIKKSIRTQAIGVPHLAILRIGGRGGHKAWKHRSETGGGAANEMLVHMLDTAQWIFGNGIPTIQDCFSDTLIPSRTIENADVSVDAEDIVTMRLKYGDVTVLIEADLITPSFMDYIEAHGSTGSILISTSLPSHIFNEKGLVQMQFPKVDWFKEELGHWLECIRQGFDPGANTIAETVKVMEVLEQVRAGR